MKLKTKTARRIGYLALFLLAVFVSPVVLYLGILFLQDEFALNKAGEVTDALVTDIRSQGRNYDVKYRFSVDNGLTWYSRADRTGRRDLWSSLPEEQWQIAQATGRVQIVFLHTDPWVNRPIAYPYTVSPIGDKVTAIVCLGIAPWVLIPVVIAADMRRRRKERCQLEQAIDLIQSGHLASGKQRLNQILKANPDNAQAWLWMAHVAEEDEQRRQCLQTALRLNPKEPAAKRELAKLQEGMRPSETVVASRPASSLSYPDVGRLQLMSYAPRLLTPGCSLWLPRGRQVSLISGHVIVNNREGTCYLARLPASTLSVKINGQPFTDMRVLRDGDFIHSGKHRYLFQADPSADWRNRLDSSRPPRQMRDSRYLRDRVRVYPDGLSLDGGKTKTNWYDILCLILDIHMKRYDSRLEVTLLTWRGERPYSELDRISGLNLRRLYEWLSRVVPFDLSIANPSEWDLSPTVDAYMLAVQKLLSRVDAGQIELPVDRRIVLGQPFRFEQLGKSLILLLGSLLFSVATTWLVLKSVQNASSSQLVDVAGTLTILGIIAAVIDGLFAVLSAMAIFYSFRKLVLTLTAPSSD
jgi:hypothetical protein